MTPLEDSLALRESPPQSRGLYSSFISAVRAFRGSTQAMNPKEAIEELARCTHQVRKKQAEANLEWLNYVNRLLWVLTTRGNFVLDREEDLLNILSILQTATEHYNNYYGYKKEDPRKYAHNDPRKHPLDDDELLLQIQGRCKIIEESYIEHHTSKDRIEELKKQLKDTAEEEKRLSEKLRNTGKAVDSVSEASRRQIEEIQLRASEEIKFYKDENTRQNEQISSLKSDNSLLRTENRSLQERCRQLSSQVQYLEDDVRELKEKECKPQTVKIDHELEMPLLKDQSYFIRFLKEENSKLQKENDSFTQQQEYVVSEMERMTALRKELNERETREAENIEKSQLARIAVAKKQADEVCKAYLDDPLAHSEALFKLLKDLDEIL